MGRDCPSRSRYRSCERVHHSTAELRDALVRAGALDTAHAAARFVDLTGDDDSGTE